MPTLNSWGNQVLAANVTLNGGTCDIGSDATSGAINIGTGAAARTTTIGNGTGASSVVLNCGTGALNLGSNAIARTTTLGNTTGASVLALKYGTGDFTLASATGTVMSALDTGEITHPLQPAFLAIVPAGGITNVTGTGTVYTVIFGTEKFDNNGDYNNGSGVFTAPVTGKYLFCSNVLIEGCTNANYMQLWFENSSRIGNYRQLSRPNSNYTFNLDNSILLFLTAGDTCSVRVQVYGEASDINDVGGTADGPTTFSGYLVC